jgi:hypothetical protein
MKVTVVPAQVTTVEDRVVGNLGLSQIMLLAAPIFGGSALFVILPPVFHGAVYKIVIITLLAVLCSLMAIRIKGKILLLWLVVMLRYNLRPRYYVFNKRSMHGREDYVRSQVVELEDAPVKISRKVQTAIELSTSEVVKLQDLIDNPAANLKFEFNKKGKLHVRFTEVTQEG